MKLLLSRPRTRMIPMRDEHRTVRAQYFENQPVRFRRCLRRGGINRGPNIVFHKVVPPAFIGRDATFQREDIVLPNHRRKFSPASPFHNMHRTLTSLQPARKISPKCHSETRTNLRRVLTPIAI